MPNKGVLITAVEYIAYIGLIVANIFIVTRLYDIATTSGDEIVTQEEHSSDIPVVQDGEIGVIQERLENKDSGEIRVVDEWRLRRLSNDPFF